MTAITTRMTGITRQAPTYNDHKPLAPWNPIQNVAIFKRDVFPPMLQPPALTKFSSTKALVSS